MALHVTWRQWGFGAHAACLAGIGRGDGQRVGRRARTLLVAALG